MMEGRPGEVHVRLPFAVDRERLRAILRADGFAPEPAAESEGTGTQGWGPAFDIEGYYPYQVTTDPERPEETVFTFFLGADGTDTGAQGPQALPDRVHRELDRWLPYLVRARRPPAGPGVVPAPWAAGATEGRTDPQNSP